MIDNSRLEQEKYGRNIIYRLASTAVSTNTSITKTSTEILNSWNDNVFIHEDSSAKKGLRSPQVGALYAVLAHWTISSDIATVVLPTGVGKTETMLSLLVVNRCQHLLVTVPSDALRTQLGKKFIELGCLRELEILNQDVENPIVGILTESFKETTDLFKFVAKCNVIVTTVTLLAKQPASILSKFAQEFSHYFIDEAHHTAASSWNSLREFLRQTNAKIVQFTATPFREDGKKITGKIVYNFPLRIAQEQGFFSKIAFEPIKAITQPKADQLIAEKAIAVLRERMSQGYQNQIVMARVSSQLRANALVDIYKKLAPEFNPIVIHTGLPAKKKSENTQLLRDQKTHIIICVDMFGEGFDQPNFKIAALHDPKKGLAVTLQFIGRFVRVGNEDLGPASFIANVFDNDFQTSIEQLYNEDADWNKIIPTISLDAIDKEIEFEEIAENFSGDSLMNIISIESLNPAYSTAVYKNKNSVWCTDLTADDFKLSESDTLHLLTSSDNDAMVAIIIRNQQAQWTTARNCKNISYELFIFFNDKDHGLLFINSSENEGYYKDIAKKILNSPNPSKIEGESCFKVFYGINRLILNNVGLKQHIGRNIRYRMSIGSDVSDAISLLEKQSSTKSLIAGSGFKNGSKYSIGVSHKGRIWSIKRGNIMNQISWFREIGEILSNPSITADNVLKNTLVYKDISVLPNTEIYTLDWDDAVYEYKIEAVSLSVNGKRVPLLYSDLEITNIDKEKSQIGFRISLNVDSLEATYSAECLLSLCSDEESHPYPMYSVTSESTTATIHLEKRPPFSLGQFLEEYEPTFFFIDGSCLTGTKYVECKKEFGLFDTSRFLIKNWDNVDLSKESMWHGNIIRKDSIQYAMIQELKDSKKYSVIINDDGAGEIADIIAIALPSNTEDDELIDIELYHLKYAAKGQPSRKINNLYEVCGQAQKSTRWKQKCDSNPFELFKHIKKREEQFQKKHPNDTRIVYGNIDNLTNLKRYSRSLKFKFKVFVVQPGIDTQNTTKEMRAILACTENYLNEVAAIPLYVIGS